MITKVRHFLEYFSSHSAHPIRYQIFEYGVRPDYPDHAVDVRFWVYGITRMRFTYSDLVGMIVHHDPSASLVDTYDIDGIGRFNLVDDLDAAVVFLEEHWCRYERLISADHKSQYLKLQDVGGELTPFPGEDSVDSQTEDDLHPIVARVFGGHAFHPTIGPSGPSEGYTFRIFEFVDISFIDWHHERIIGWRYFEPFILGYSLSGFYRFDYCPIRNEDRVYAQLLDIRRWALSFLPDDYLAIQKDLYGGLPEVSDLEDRIAAYLDQYSV